MDQNSAPISSVQYKQIKHFNTSGHAHFLTFSCFKRRPFLLNEQWAQWVGESTRSTCDRYKVSLWAYVFMPEHVHLLLCSREENYDVSQWLRSIKNSVAKRILNDLRRTKSPLLSQLKTDEGSGGVEYRFWQQGPGYDKNIWSVEAAIEKANYCHINPVKRNLVQDVTQWRWSSFRWLEQGTRIGEPLQVDDWIA